VTLNNRYQAHLKPFKKIDFCARMHYKFFSSSFPHSWPCSLHSTQPKDTPLRFLTIILAVVYNMGSRYCNKKFPLPECILTSICPLVLQLGPFPSSSSLSINLSYLSFLWFTQLLY
jgi:hypothetical protein